MTKTAAMERLITIIEETAGLSSCCLPDDVVDRLTALRAKEDSAMGKRIYDAMFTDLNMAESSRRPCCQDTGVLQFFVRAGVSFPWLAELETCLREAVIRATASVPLRPNVVECFDEKNTGNNTGKHIPWIDWEIVPGTDKLELFMYMAGGGCSLPGFARVFMPLDGYEGALKAVVDQVRSYGVNACPPLLVGIGLSGQADTAAKLSKKALLRFIGTRNSNPKAAALEEKLELTLNSIGIGAGGFGGNHSVMAVHIEEAGRHTAALAVGLSTGCWAHRRVLIEIGADLNYTIVSHKRAAQQWSLP
ncbi:tartrate dehydratase subunit alpha [Spirochaetia bacterium]|nr:tartrate dehydratase subunit alpha [Spirochaetia bacterium]